MLENLINLIRENAGDAIINNNAIPNENNEKAIYATATSITDVLSNAVSEGNLNGIMDLFNANTSNTDNPIVSNIIDQVKSKLTGELNIDENESSNISNSLVPNIIDKFVNKTNDPNDSNFDLKDIMSNIGGGNLDINSIISGISGGNSGGIGNMIGNLFGK
jgi:hypothetical protein